MPRNYQYDVFISYRRSDASERAQLIREILKRKGYDENRIFVDVHSIHEGEFPERIKSALNNSEAFILLISNNSFYGESTGIDYYYEEIKQALELKIKFIPILFDNTTVDSIELPEEIKEKGLKLKQAITYHPDYIDGFEAKLSEFLKPEKKRWSDMLVVPTILILLYGLVVFLCGLGTYIHDNYFLSHEKQIEIVCNNMGEKDGLFFYMLPNELVTFDPKTDEVEHVKCGDDLDIVINAQVSREQLYKASFFAVATPIFFNVTKYKTRIHNQKALVVYAVVAIAVIAGFGLGITLERMLFPIQLSSRIKTNLNDPTFWNEVLIRKYQRPSSISSHS